MSLTVLLVLGLLGLYLFLRGGQRASPRDVDQATLGELVAAGSDLARPHEVEFYLYFPAEAVARQVGETLGAEGFRISVTPGEASGEWLCLATRAMVPALPELHALRDRFTRLAAGHEGLYDGWGATVVEGEAGTAGA